MKKIIMFGRNKIQRDLEYVFKFAPDLYLTLDPKEQSNDKIKKAVDFNRDITGDSVIIICNKKEDCEEERLLKAKGLHYQKEYLFAEDLFQYINPLLQYSKGSGRKLAVWGTGSAARDFMKALYKWEKTPEIEFFIDNNQSIEIFEGHQVKSPDSIHNWKEYFVVIAVSNAYVDVKRQIENYGLEEKQDFIFYQAVMEDLEPLLYKTVYALPICDEVCRKPMGRCENSWDQVFLCCPMGLPVSVGNLKTASFWDIWHSNKARIIRLSIVNRTYTFCNMDNCFEFKPELKKVVTEEQEMENYKIEELNFPASMNVGFDGSCNLSCPCCRRSMYVAVGDQRKEIEKEADKWISDILPYCDNVWLAGLGEVFFSPTYRRILEQLPQYGQDKISIFTNGTLINEDTWKLLEGKYRKIRFAVSVDGIEKDTFEALRRGSNFQEVKKNIAFLGKLRRDLKIERLFVSCVVQEKNIRELNALIKWSKDIGADYILMSKLDNSFEVYPNESFDSVSVFDKEGNLKEQYQKYITKEMLEDQQVLWGSCFKELRQNISNDNYDYFPQV